MISPPSLILWATIVTFMTAAIVSVGVATAMRFVQKRSWLLPLFILSLGVLSALFSVKYAQLTVPSFPGWPIPSAAGRPYFFLISLAFLLFPIGAYLASGRDLKQARQYAEASEAQARAANHEIRALQQQLSEATRRGAEQHRLFQEWRYLIISNVGHELRTPVTFILGFIEMILEGTFGEISAPLHGPLSEVRTSTRRIDLIIERMAATWREPHLLETDIAIICRQTMDNPDIWINARRQASEVTFTSDIPNKLPVIGDTDMLRVAILDLLNNAIKFGATHIHVSVAQDGTNAIVRVEDDGVGVPLKYHRRIFEPLFQVDMGSTRRYEGAGMGLAAVEDIAHKHGGHVFVQNRVGQRGAIFNLVLPIAKVSDAG